MEKDILERLSGKRPHQVEGRGKGGGGIAATLTIVQSNLKCPVPVLAAGTPLTMLSF